MNKNLENALHLPPRHRPMPKVNITPMPADDVSAPVDHANIVGPIRQAPKTVRPMGTASVEGVSRGNSTPWVGPSGTEPRPAAVVRPIAPAEAVRTGSAAVQRGARITPQIGSQGMTSTARTIRPSDDRGNIIQAQMNSPRGEVEVVGGTANQFNMHTAADGRVAGVMRQAARKPPIGPRNIAQVYDPTENTAMNPAQRLVNAPVQIHDPMNPFANMMGNAPRPAQRSSMPGGPPVTARGVEVNNPLEGRQNTPAAQTGIVQPMIVPIHANSGANNNLAAHVMPGHAVSGPMSHPQQPRNAPAPRQVGRQPIPTPSVNAVQNWMPQPPAVAGVPQPMTPITPMAAPATEGEIASTASGAAVMMQPQIIPLEAAVPTMQPNVVPASVPVHPPIYPPAAEVAEPPMVLEDQIRQQWGAQPPQPVPAPAPTTTPVVEEPAASHRAIPRGGSPAPVAPQPAPQPSAPSRARARVRG